MSAHPEILGDISCEQSYVELQHLLSPWRDSSWEPPPHSPTPKTGVSTCYHCPLWAPAGGERELAPPWDAMGGELVSHWEGHHGCEAPLWSSIIDALLLKERVPPMCFSRGAMRSWWPENLVDCRRGRIRFWQGWGPDPAFQLSAWRQDWCFGDGSVRVLTGIRNRDLGTKRLFGRWSQETPIRGVTIEDAWGSVPAWTLWETVSSHWQVRKLGCSSLKSYPHRLIHSVSCLPMQELHTQLGPDSIFRQEDAGRHRHGWKLPVEASRVGPVLLQGRVQKESSSEGGEKEPMSVSQAWPKSSDAWSQRDEWEGLYISTCGCLNISTWDCLTRCCECLYISTCENLNIWIWECIPVSICEYLNAEHLDTSMCECLNILTCGCQPVNVSVVVMHSCLNVLRCKCHNRPTCDVSACEPVDVSASQHENVLPSQYMNASLTAHECQGATARKSWGNHCFFPKQSPSEP